ncbi:hypothetical protein BDN72DRAFT_905792 [Pluteus cervinus]|uniref:Uncharacterized protein n=1 Tax=Pluteus cervinus TaxID=181527 RepID=A0ACD3A2H0_9AGAR|nr:hypothetical protein BDN72DRAFT_905792 [Pluteus cervinus]
MASNPPWFQAALNKLKSSDLPLLVSSFNNIAKEPILANKALVLSRELITVVHASTAVLSKLLEDIKLPETQSEDTNNTSKLEGSDLAEFLMLENHIHDLRTKHYQTILKQFHGSRSAKSKLKDLEGLFKDTSSIPAEAEPVATASEDLNFALDGLANWIPHLSDIGKTLVDQRSITPTDFATYFCAFQSVEIYSSLVSLHLARKAENRISGDHIKKLLELLTAPGHSQSHATRMELVDKVVKDLEDLEINTKSLH